MGPPVLRLHPRFVLVRRARLYLERSRARRRQGHGRRGSRRLGTDQGALATHGLGQLYRLGTVRAWSYSGLRFERRQDLGHQFPERRVDGCVRLSCAWDWGECDLVGSLGAFCFGAESESVGLGLGPAGTGTAAGADAEAVCFCWLGQLDQDLGV